VFIIAFLMLLAPGLIAVRILWREKTISQDDWKLVVIDYFVYSFLIMLAVYAFMFFTYPDRTVSFSVNVTAISTILTASFVFKYSIVALISALILPIFVPWVIRIWTSLEDKRDKRNKNKRR